MPTLKPCPCGQTPERLKVAPGSKPRWDHAYVYGDCCIGWRIEFFLGFVLNSEQGLALATEAWNAAPRAQPPPRPAPSRWDGVFKKSEEAP